MAELTVLRRKATLVSADAAGYSRLMAADDIATIQDITRHREGADQIAQQHGGRLVDSPGDNLLFEFDHPNQALHAALAFQAAVQTTNEKLPSEQRMLFRIGIDSGEVVVDGGRIYGSGINIAARLERLARPGGICISSRASEGLSDPPALEDIGEQRVKNIPEPVHAYFVSVPGEIAAVPRDIVGTRPTIAVLPFDNLTGDPEQDYLVDGLCEDLLTSLAVARQFRVIARSSAFSYKGLPLDIKQIGQELGASYLVVGSVRKSGTRVRIAAQLLDPLSGHQVWADRWDADFADIFEAQTEIAQAISVVLRPELLKVESERALRQAPADMGAWDFALRGLWHLHTLRSEGNKTAIALLERAIALDPTSAFAHALLAQAHYLAIEHQWTSDQAQSLAKLIAHADLAVECDPDEASGHLFRGLAFASLGRPDRALAPLHRAVELHPSLPVAQSLLGQILGILGRTDEGLLHINRAIALSPRDPNLWSFHGGIGVVNFIAERYPEARNALEHSLAIFPDAGPSLCFLAATLALQGDLSAAAEALQELRHVWPTATAQTLSTTGAVVPPAAKVRFFEGLRLAGFKSDPVPPQ